MRLIIPFMPSSLQQLPTPTHQSTILVHHQQEFRHEHPFVFQDRDDRKARSPCVGCRAFSVVAECPGTNIRNSWSTPHRKPMASRTGNTAPLCRCPVTQVLPERGGPSGYSTISMLPSSFWKSFRW